MQHAPYHGVICSTTMGQLQHNVPEYTLGTTGSFAILLLKGALDNILTFLLS